MTKTQTKAELALESGHVEWKQALGERKEIVETCAAFATASGGDDTPRAQHCVVMRKGPDHADPARRMPCLSCDINKQGAKWS